MKKIKKLFMVGVSFIMLLLSACSITSVTPTDGKTPEKTPTEGVTETIGENEVKIKSISATKTEVAKKSRSRQNADGEEVTGETTPEVTGDDVVTVNDNINYIIIYKSQTDITFTITLDNPEAYGIDALRVTCDDPEAQIQVDGEFKPIAQEADKTRVINWSSEDPYTKTYNIKTTSEEAIATFKVVDIRLAGHEKFQSKETENTDLGNNELKIYKMDDDAIELNVIENTFEYIKFDFIVKVEYTDVISNIKVDGVDRDDEIGGWRLEESKTAVISYDYLLEEYNVKVVRSEDVEIELLNFSFKNNGLSDVNIIRGLNVLSGIPMIINFTSSSGSETNISSIINKIEYEGSEVQFVYIDYYNQIISEKEFKALVVYTDNDDFHPHMEYRIYDWMEIDQINLDIVNNYISKYVFYIGENRYYINIKMGESYNTYDYEILVCPGEERWHN